jgi:hypothetical protein
VANSIILPFNKSKQLAEKSLTGSGTEQLRVAVEQPAASLAFTFITITENVIVSIYEVGDTNDAAILLSRQIVVPSISKTLNLTIPCNGPIRIDIEYTSAISYSLRGKAIDIYDEVKTVTLTNEQDTLIWQSQVLATLSLMCENLERVVSHIRYITDISSEDGEIY